MPDKSSVAAFYLKRKEDTQVTSKIDKTLKEKFQTEIKSIVAGLKEKILGFDAKEFAKNFAAECPSAFVMKYASALIVNIANGRAVKFDALLDILFIDLAPLMKQTQLFLGYMTYDKFRLAIKNNSGQINVYGLLQGMNYALRTLQNEKKIKELENQYEEIIPIDLIESCSFSYEGDNANFVNLTTEKGLQYVGGAEKVGIKLVGHMKNLNGNFTKSNDYIQKLEKCMAYDNKTKSSDKTDTWVALGQVTLRVGSDIYENCFIRNLNAEVSSPAKEGGGVYDMKITADIWYNLTKDMAFEPNGLTTVNPYPKKERLIGDFYRWTKDMA